MRPARLRLDLSYDGAAFVGWAAQPGLPSVEGTLAGALTTLARSPVKLVVAGRTDAGVHARGQVAHADVPLGLWTGAPGRSSRSPATAVVNRLNGLLRRARGGQQDIVVRAASLAPPGFDARFSALWRRYTYRICDAAAPRDPLARGHQLWHGRALNVEAMSAAAAPLVGEHDFLAFCKPRPGASTVREIQRLQVTRTPAGVIELTVQADAFCHSMVRALTGALLAVGEGRWPVTRPGELLAARDRTHLTVAPAHGLTLEEVGYPPAGQLAARAAQTRAYRGT